MLLIWNPDGWGEMARLIGEQSYISWIFFVMFVAVAGLGLMNLLTAVFVEALMEQTKMHERRVKWQKEQDRTNTLAQVSEAFQEFDADENGTLDSQELAGVIISMHLVSAGLLFEWTGTGDAAG